MVRKGDLIINEKCSKNFIVWIFEYMCMMSLVCLVIICCLVIDYFIDIEFSDCY